MLKMRTQTIGVVHFAPLALGKNGKMGNIFEQDIFDIFNSDKTQFYVNFSKSIEEESCKNCSYNSFCAVCISKIYTANIQRLKDGLELCEIAKRNKMDKYFDFNVNYSDFKFNV